MKKSAMAQLYGGECAMYDNIPLSAEYKKFGDEALKQCDELEKTLTDEQKQQLDKLLELEIFKSAEYAESNFIEGLKLGIRLGIEAMDE